MSENDYFMYFVKLYSCLLVFFFSQNKSIISITVSWPEMVEKGLSNLYKDPMLMIILINVEQSRNVPNILRLLPFNFVSILRIHVKFLINVYSFTLIV